MKRYRYGLGSWVKDKTSQAGNWAGNTQTGQWAQEHPWAAGAIGVSAMPLVGGLTGGAGVSAFGAGSAFAGTPTGMTALTGGLGFAGRKLFNWEKNNPASTEESSSEEQSPYNQINVDAGTGRVIYHDQPSRQTPLYSDPMMGGNPYSMYPSMYYGTPYQQTSGYGMGSNNMAMGNNMMDPQMIMNTIGMFSNRQGQGNGNNDFSNMYSNNSFGMGDGTMDVGQMNSYGPQTVPVSYPTTSNQWYRDDGRGTPYYGNNNIGGFLSDDYLFQMTDNRNFGNMDSLPARKYKRGGKIVRRSNGGLADEDVNAYMNSGELISHGSNTVIEADNANVQDVSSTMSKLVGGPVEGDQVGVSIKGNDDTPKFVTPNEETLKTNPEYKQLMKEKELAEKIKGRIEKTLEKRKGDNLLQDELKRIDIKIEGIKTRELELRERQGIPITPQEEGQDFEETGFKEGGRWIQKATKGMRKDKPCTGSKFGSSSCPKGSKRYNLAKTFRKMAKGHEEGGVLDFANGGNYAYQYGNQYAYQNPNQYSNQYLYQYPKNMNDPYGYNYIQQEGYPVMANPYMDQSINQWEGNKDTFGKAMPIAGMFRGIEKAGTGQVAGIGMAAGMDPYRANLMGKQFFDPYGAMMMRRQYGDQNPIMNTLNPLPQIFGWSNPTWDKEKKGFNFGKRTLTFNKPKFTEGGTDGEDIPPTGYLNRAGTGEAFMNPYTVYIGNNQSFTNPNDPVMFQHRMYLPGYEPNTPYDPTWYENYKKGIDTPYSQYFPTAIKGNIPVTASTQKPTGTTTTTPKTVTTPTGTVETKSTEDNAVNTGMFTDPNTGEQIPIDANNWNALETQNYYPTPYTNEETAQQAGWSNQTVQGTGQNPYAFNWNQFGQMMGDMATSQQQQASIADARRLNDWLVRNRSRMIDDMQKRPTFRDFYGNVKRNSRMENPSVNMSAQMGELEAGKRSTMKALVESGASAPAIIQAGVAYDMKRGQLLQQQENVNAELKMKATMVNLQQEADEYKRLYDARLMDYETYTDRMAAIDASRDITWQQYMIGQTGAQKDTNQMLKDYAALRSINQMAPNYDAYASGNISFSEPQSAKCGGMLKRYRRK